MFKDGGHTEAAKELVRFLVADGWLETYLTHAGDRLLPPSRRMLDQPFWLDPRDPHRLQAAVQALSQPHVWGPYGLDREEGSAPRARGSALRASARPSTASWPTASLPSRRPTR